MLHAVLKYLPAELTNIFSVLAWFLITLPRKKSKPGKMKKLLSLLTIVLVTGLMSVSAQNFKYTVKSSGDCTNRTAEFTVPAGKVAKLICMDIVPSWTTCNTSEPAPTTNYAQVYVKVNASASLKNKNFLYRKTIDHSGGTTESTPIQDVKLNPGTYTLEVSRASHLEATLEIKLSAN